MYIEKIKLRDGEELNPTLFNVIIGGNAVGKTTILLELFDNICSANRSRWYWVDTLIFNSTDMHYDISLMLQSMVRQWEGSNLYYYSQATRNRDGNLDLGGNLRFSPSEYDKIKRDLENEEPQLSIELFGEPKYRRPFTTLLNCETRLILPSAIEVIRLDQPPQNPLNVLYRNRRLLREISDAIKNQFALELNLLSHKATIIDLGLADNSAPLFDPNTEDLQVEFEKVEVWKSQNFTPVEEIGHGIRSMLRILLSLLDPMSQIFLIDEPEMHLYPSQKRWVGRQLVKLAREQQKQVFIVTHDPMVLQGILDTQGTTTIYRVDQDNNRNRQIKSCILENIPDVGAIRNQDQYLQGLFYQRCIAVEGASDRAFYQSMVEDYSEIEDKDLGFIACGGKGSSKYVVSIAVQTGLRCAFIYDFDAILSDLGTIEDIYSMLGGDTSQLGSLKAVVDSLVSDKHATKPAAIKQAERLGIQSPLVQDHYAVFDKAMKALNAVGIFVVPHGTLESWAPDVEPKVRFPDKAPDVVRADPALKARFDDFMRPILNYLGC
ncbi:hypothetical protein ES707_16336 [subsurface metagenome]